MSPTPMCKSSSTEHPLKSLSMVSSPGSSPVGSRNGRNSEAPSIRSRRWRAASSPHRMIQEALGISYSPDLRTVQNANQTAISWRGARRHQLHTRPTTCRSQQAQRGRVRAEARPQLHLAFRKDAPDEVKRVAMQRDCRSKMIRSALRTATKSLGIKALLVLAAATLPALIVAAVLGATWSRSSAKPSATSQCKPRHAT